MPYLAGSFCVILTLFLCLFTRTFMRLLAVSMETLFQTYKTVFLYALFSCIFLCYFYDFLYLGTEKVSSVNSICHVGVVQKTGILCILNPIKSGTFSDKKCVISKLKNHTFWIKISVLIIVPSFMANHIYVHILDGHAT